MPKLVPTPTGQLPPIQPPVPPSVSRPSQSADPAKLAKSAHDFEAMAIGQLLQPMFDTVKTEKNGFGGGAGEEAWKPMLVQEFAKQIEGPWRAGPGKAGLRRNDPNAEGKLKMSNDLMDAGERLADVLAQENEALSRMDFASAVALIPAKEAALADLTKQPAPSAAASTLTELGQRLGDLATENQALLERAVAVQTRIVRIVAQACTPPADAAQYNRNGNRAAVPRMAAMALSTRA